MVKIRLPICNKPFVVASLFFHFHVLSAMGKVEGETECIFISYLWVAQQFLQQIKSSAG